MKLFYSVHHIDWSDREERTLFKNNIEAAKNEIGWFDFNKRWTEYDSADQKLAVFAFRNSLSRTYRYPEMSMGSP